MRAVDESRELTAGYRVYPSWHDVDVVDQQGVAALIQECASNSGKAMDRKPLLVTVDGLGEDEEGRIFADYTVVFSPALHAF